MLIAAGKADPKVRFSPSMKKGGPGPAMIKKATALILAAVMCLCVIPAMADYLTVTANPEDRTCAAGETVQFEASATGDGIRYRWQTRSPAGGSWVDAPYAGNSGPVLRVTAEGSMNGRQFRCVITDAGGSSAATLPATLTVTRGGTDWEEDDTPSDSNVQINPGAVEFPEQAAVPSQTAVPSETASPALPSGTQPSRGANAESVTVMIYLNGADLESEDGSASRDIAEMLNAGVGKNVRVVIETLGTRKWQKYGISSRTAQRWLVNGSSLDLVQDRLGKVSVGEASSLSDFISWTKKNYPSDRYMLVMWNHGGGAVYGFGTDEWDEDSDDSLTMDELRTALGANPDVRFDFIGMDACLMGSLEVCLALAPYCDYSILSEDFESAKGWYYTDWLKALEKDPALDTAELGRKIVDGMIAVNRKSGSDATLAVINESRVQALFGAWTAFAYANESALLRYNYSTERESQGRALRGIFSDARDDDDVTLSSYYVTDIMAVAANTATAESRALEEALASAVIYSDTTSRDSLTGLGVTLPYGDGHFYEDLRIIFSRCGIDGDYIAWLEKFVEASGTENYYDYDPWYDSWFGWDDWAERQEENYSIYGDDGWDDWDSWDGGGGDNNVSR